MIKISGQYSPSSWSEQINYQKCNGSKFIESTINDPNEKRATFKAQYFREEPG